MKVYEKALERSAPKVLRRFYTFLFLAMVFTGFGQMPIFKRYYVADVPELAWSADFYFTHMLHYVGASLLLALMSYLAFNYVFSARKRFALTGAAYVRILLLGGIVATGVFRVLKNLPDFVFSPSLTLFIDIAHLGLMMLYGATALVFFVRKSKWLVYRSRPVLVDSLNS